MKWPNGSLKQVAFDTILDLVPKGSTIVEMGSGFSTGQLAKYYNVYSIEQDAKWLNKYPSTYIYAPIQNGWYDVNVLQAALPTNYNLLIVDGPAAKSKHKIIRLGLLQHHELFNLNCPIMVHDTKRIAEHKLAISLGQLVKRPVKFYNTHNFALI